MSQIIPYLAPGALTNTQSDVTDLQSLSGVPDNSVNLGTFTGSTIPDNQTTKQALQALETEVEDRLPDFVQWQRKDGGYRFSSTAYQSTPVSDFGTADFSAVFGVNFTAVPSGTQNIFGKTAGNSRWLFFVDATAYKLSITDSGGTTSTYSFGVAATTTDKVVGFTADRDGDATLYVNGESAGNVAISASSAVNLGASNTNNLTIGTASSGFRNDIHSVRLFNRALSAADVAKYSRGEATDFSDRVTSASAIYTQDTSAGVDGWTGGVGTAAGNIDGISGKDDVLRYTANTSNSSHKLAKNFATIGKRYRLSFQALIGGSNSNIDTLKWRWDGSATYTTVTATGGSWQSYTVETVATATTLEIYGFDGATQVFADAGGDDVFYLAESEFTELGEVASYLPESSTPTIWADVSPLGRHATNNGATHIFNRRLYADAFVQLTNLPTSSAGLATGQVWNDSGTLKIV